MRQLLAIGILMFCTGQAHALDVIGPAPNFYNGKIVVGTTFAGVTKVYYKSGLHGSGDCVGVYNIDPNHNTQIKGTSGSNEVRVLGGSETFTDCNGTVGFETLRAFQPATMTISFVLGAGTDWFYTPNRMVGLYVDGGNGNDFLFAGEAFALFGGPGDDVLVADSQSPNFTITDLLGGDGVDYLCAWAYIDVMDGDAEVDWGWFSFAEPAHIYETEGAAGQTACSDKRVAGLSAFDD